MGKVAKLTLLLLALALLAGTPAVGWAQSPGEPFARDPSKDVLTTEFNDSAGALWSDGTTMWVADDYDDKIYAYNLGTKQWDAEKDFDTLEGAGNNSPRGIWSDGTTMWVADSVADKIYAYNLGTKQRDAEKDFDTLEGTGNNLLLGIWSDGTTMWVGTSRLLNKGVHVRNRRFKSLEPGSYWRKLCRSQGTFSPFGFADRPFGGRRA